MGHQVTLADTPQASESGGVITVRYNAQNSGDSETGGTWDQAVVLNAHGEHVYDTSKQIHSVDAGGSYQGELEQMQAVGHGTYTVNLVVDSESTSDPAWSGQVVVGG
jgi:hypothetical protein